MLLICWILMKYVLLLLTYTTTSFLHVIIKYYLEMESKVWNLPRCWKNGDKISYFSLSVSLSFDRFPKRNIIAAIISQCWKQRINLGDQLSIGQQKITTANFVVILRIVNVIFCIYLRIPLLSMIFDDLLDPFVAFFSFVLFFVDYWQTFVKQL